jgi:protocatechuate 3,4-dioxygenase alpha subunit
MRLPPTASQTAGPYVHLGLTLRNPLATLAGKHAQGERMRLCCHVTDGDGVPVPDAVVEIWQANSLGKYQHPEDTQQKPDDPDCYGFGRLPVGEDGCCQFETIKPGRVPGPGDSWQAPHFNLSIFARGLLKRLVTRAYFGDDPGNAEDPILAVVPVERRETLMAQPDPSRPGNWLFEIRFSGTDETVFFDV